MSDVSQNKTLLAKEFEKNNLHINKSHLLGLLFGKLHGKTYGRKKVFYNKNMNQVLLNEVLSKFTFAGARKYLPNEVE